MYHDAHLLINFDINFARKKIPIPKPAISTVQPIIFTKGESK